MSDDRQKAHDGEVEMLRQQIRQLQSLATLGELTSTATHEFNNVLMTVLNYAKLGMRYRDEPTRDKALQRIHDAAQRAAKITSTILAQARNRGSDLAPTALEPIVRDTLVLLERELRKYRISVETDFAPVADAMANGNQIQRVLINLLINARQAMPEGGSVRITLAQDGDQIVLTVRDTGCGIDAERLPKIFDAYYSTKSGPDDSGTGGTGLGLAACKEIIELHRGRIRVESRIGSGTAFVIRLPAAATSSPTQAVA